MNLILSNFLFQARLQFACQLNRSFTTVFSIVKEINCSNLNLETPLTVTLFLKLLKYISSQKYNQDLCCFAPVRSRRRQRYLIAPAVSMHSCLLKSTSDLNR